MSLTGQRDRVSNYYSASMGKIVKSLGKTEPEDMTGVSKRVNKNGDTVYEIVADYIGGYIKSLELKEPPADKQDFGSQIVVELENGGQRAKINIKFDSAYGRGFLYSFPNVNLDTPVELEPYQYFSKKKGRDITGLSIIQNGSQLDWAFGTRDNTGGMPPLQKVTFKGKETWDNTDQIDFLKEKFKTFIAQVNQTPEPKVQEEFVPTEVEQDPSGLDF